MLVYGITGWKNAGKTGCVERVVTELTARGYRVSTIKHAHHSVDVDHKGKDSYRHRTAGAHEVVLASNARLAIMQEHRGAPPPKLEAILARMNDVDIVIVEGFKRDSHPKIECFRAQAGHQLRAAEDQTIHAVATDTPVDCDVPQIDLNDTARIVDFILADLGIG